MRRSTKRENPIPSKTLCYREEEEMKSMGVRREGRQG